MIPDNCPKLKIAFQKYLSLADYTEPDNTQDQYIRHKFMKGNDLNERAYRQHIEELHHLASFIWGEAGGEDMFVMTPEILPAIQAKAHIEREADLMVESFIATDHSGA